MIFQDKSVFKPVLDSKEFLNYMCWRHQRHNLLSLREIVGDAGMVSLLDRFAGTYVRFPSASNTLQAANDIIMCLLYQELKKAFATRNPVLWQEAETKFIKFAERQGLNYLQAKKKSKLIYKDIQAATTWMNDVKNWEKRNQKEE